MDSPTNKRLSLLKQLGCKLLFETRNLTDEVGEPEDLATHQDLKDTLAFLEKITNIQISMLRKLQHRDDATREGDSHSSDPWDDIADEVHGVLDDVTIEWPPTPRGSSPVASRALSTSRTANERPSAPTEPPRKKRKRAEAAKHPRKRRANENENPDDEERDRFENVADEARRAKLTKEQERQKDNASRLDAIVRYVTTKPKAGADSLWRRTIDYNTADHKSEESMAFARLLQGYKKLTTSELNSWFGDAVRKDGAFKTRIGDHLRIHDQCDDATERMHYWYTTLTEHDSQSQVQSLIHNILSIIIQIQMAEEWGNQDQRWKTMYITDAFKTLKKKDISNARHSMTLHDYNIWFEESRNRFRDHERKAFTARNWTLALYKEFGSIVLLDSRWNPLKYSKDNHSEGFGLFLQHFLTNLAHRYAKPDEDQDYPYELQWDVDKPLVKYHYGHDNDNDHTVIETVRFITGDDSIADFVADFINKRSTLLGKQPIRSHSRHPSDSN